MTEDARNNPMPHNLIMQDRKSLSVTGVSDVDSFDEHTVIMYTNMGELTVKGDDLHINKLNVDTGDVALEGKIYSLSYTDDTPKGKSLLSKLFK